MTLTKFNTVGELYEEWLDKRVLTRHKRPENVRYFWKAYGHQWRDILIKDVTHFMIQDWFDAVAREKQYAATRGIASLSAMFNWGLRRGKVDLAYNPCSRVEKFKLRSRTRFMRPEELAAFDKSLRKESQLWQDFFWLCLYTGARRGNVESMEWSEIDLQLAMWTIPAEKYKNGQEHMIALTRPALEILERRKKDSSLSPFVFASRSKCGHIVEIRKVWKRIVERAGIEDLRPHDLRRTLGSYLAIRGFSLEYIGKILGQLDPRSTQVYARLNIEPTRRALKKAHLMYYRAVENVDRSARPC